MTLFSSHEAYITSDQYKANFLPIMPSTPKIITIDKEPIRLGQFLKLANLAQDGLEAKIQIQNGEVWVNGSVEKRRGRKLSQGDQIMMGDLLYQIQCTKNE